LPVQHHIALGSKDPFWGDVECLGVAVDKGNDLLWVIDITEDDPTARKLRE
jgi:hypothetical protein